MKLFVVLSVIACGYAAKLDRTYLPPAGAGTSGGSPGSLKTPLGPSAFGQPAGFGQLGPNSGFNAPAGNTPGSAFGGPSGNNGFGAPSNQYGQPGGSTSGQTVGANFDSGFSAPAQNFVGNQAQDYQRSQPQRTQASAEQSAEILRSDNQNDGETFSYSFETSNGISAEESGVATNGVQAQGAFAYSSDDGQMFRVQYTADENGYRPQGDHLPTSPPIPEEILKSIEENARAAASGTQEGAYDPNEDNDEVSFQQYNSNAPTSYNQAPTGQNGFNQAGKSPAKLYATPDSGSRLESFQGFSQGPSQQYNAGSGVPNSESSRPLNVFGQSQVKSQSQYGSPSNGVTGSSGFGKQGPSGQYSAGPSGTSNFAPSASQGQSQQYQTSQSGQFSSVGRPQGSAQAQDASGYQYNKAQGGIGGNLNNGPSQQSRPQNGASSGLQGFSKPNGNSFPSSRLSSQSPFGASPSSQGSYGSAPSSQGSFSSSGIKGASSFGSNNQASFGSPTRPNSQGSFGFSGANGSPGPNSPSTFGSNSQTSYGSSAKPNSAFSPSAGSQPSFGASSNGFGRPQTPGSKGQGFGRLQGQAPAAKSPIPDSGYEYNRPSGSSPSGGAQAGSAPFGSSSQNGFQREQGRPAQFGAARAPPSFSEEEGYKY